MRKKIILSLLAIATLAQAGNIKKENHSYNSKIEKKVMTKANNLSLYSSVEKQLDLYPVFDLTQEQKDGLIFMYQEEKLARDIYLNMYSIYGIKIFSNIAKSEQSHMDAIKVLLDRYAIEVPENDEVGIYEDDTLQTLYYELYNMGIVSSNDALIVGKIIEETDIKDLENNLEEVPDDISFVYEKLLVASYKHLNAFNKKIK